MSSRTVSRFVLVCDGCERSFDEMPSPMDARAKAYGLGWRFPSKLKRDGGSSNRTHDVCPDCLPDFEPQIDSQAYTGKKG